MHQSSGKLQVKKRIQTQDWWSLYGRDWFHSLVDAPTSRIILVLMLIYISVILFFGVIYYTIRRRYYCELNFDTFMGAFDFSLEVMATFGFSTTIDACVSMSATVLAQSCVRLIVESFTIGVLYSRFARPHSRASTVIFSNKAVIRRVRGKLYFMFQLCELRKHQLVEAHVRLYVVRRENDSTPTTTTSGAPTSFVQTCTMRLNHPNDELGGMLLLMMPQVVVHELDISSPLMPPPVWTSNHRSSVISQNATRSSALGGNSRPFQGPNWKTLSDVSRESTIRWNPPVYRHFIRPSLAQSRDNRQGLRPSHFGSHEKHEKDAPAMAGYEYDVELLSNLDFPNVARRGSDVQKDQRQAYDNMMAERSPKATIAENHRSTPQRLTFEGNLTGARQNKSESGLKAGSSSSQSQSTDYHMNNNNVTPSRPHIHVSKAGDEGHLPIQDLLNSPGLSRYGENIQPKHTRSKAEEAMMDENSSLMGEEVFPFEDHHSLSPIGEDSDDLEPRWQFEERQMVQRYLMDRQIEVIAVVEGVDSATGGNVQARHSYIYSEIEWNKTFQYCMFEDPDDGLMTVDFDLFHELVEASTDAAHSGAIPSCV